MVPVPIFFGAALAGGGLSTGVPKATPVPGAFGIAAEHPPDMLGSPVGTGGPHPLQLRDPAPGRD